MWFTTSCRKLREAKEHGGIPNRPAVIKPNDVNGGYSWFFNAASRIKGKAKESSNVDVGDPEQHLDVTKDTAQDADEELNDIVLQNPQISGATLINTMKTRGLRVSKTTEAWRKRVNSLIVREQVSRDKWASCVHKVQRRGDVDSPYAVCTAQLGTPTKESLEYAAARVLGKHFKIKKKVEEADSSSSFVQVTREAKFNFKSMNLKEAASDDGIGPTKFKVVLLQEGLGNFGDAFYYDKSALDSAVPIFTGTKIFADHPSAVEEEVRPERSVRDVLGHFENIKVETDKNDRAMLTGEVHVLPDKPFEWARALIRHAIDHSKKFPDQPFVGLSINASGDADETSIDEVMKAAPSGAKPKLEEAKGMGIESVRVVRKIKDAISCDLVTEAGAGGGIVSVVK